ncbi:MAG: thiamine phosphate synthase [Dehalococcoidia bacterium]|nr:thiamine phosphate synthase [Dehalococcoidia bacterium]
MKPKLPLPCLCLVTDRGRTASDDIVNTARGAVAGGVGMVQLRDKDCPAAEMLSLARELRSVTEGRALLIVNDRVDIALLSGADGVQLGENGLDAASARRLVGSEMLIGRSVHSVEGAVKAESSGADFLVLGTIFETASHPGADTGGLKLVRDVTDRIGIPVIGIGGISKSNVAGLVESGAAGAAVITAVSMAADPKAASLNILEAMRHAYSCVAELRL